MDWVDLTVSSVFAAFTLGFVLIVLLVKVYGRQYKQEFSRTVGLELGHAFVFISPSRLFALNCCLVMACSLLALAVSQSLLPAAAVAIGFAVVPRVVLRRLRQRRIWLFRQQLPELIAVLSGGVRAGASLTGALGEVAAQLPAPAGQEISLVLRESRMGSTLDQAILGLERRLPTEETVLLVSALRLGRQSGGSIASTLDTLADTMRRKLVLEQKIRALTAQGRLQAWVMGLLPFLVLGAMLILDPGLWEAYFGTLMGWSVMGTVAILQLIGAYLIRRMVNIEV